MPVKYFLKIKIYRYNFKGKKEDLRFKEIKKYTGKTPRELSKNENVRFLQLATKRNE